MGVGKLHSVGGQLVDVRRGDFGIGIKASRIAIAHVVGENDDDVGFVGSEGGAQTEEGKGELLECGHCESLGRLVG